LFKGAGAMADKNESGEFLVGFWSAVVLSLFVLKISGTLAWSWWWITAPLWGPFALLFLVLIIGSIFFFIAEALDKNGKSTD